MTGSYRLHKNIYITQVDIGVYALYNPIYMHKVLYVSEEIYNQVKKNSGVSREDFRSDEVFEQLIKQKFLVPFEFDDNLPIRKIADTFYSRVPEIRIMYLILTEQCNFRCTYCFIEENIYQIDGKKRLSLMSQETADRAIDMFLRVAENDGENKVIIYGGEPLINREVFIYVVKRLRAEEAAGKIHNLEIIVNTNASLIDEEIADVFARFNLIPAISIDGTPQIHDSGRIDYAGKGTFHSTLRGYNKLTKKNISPAISCTVTKFNVSQLQEAVSFFVTELNAKNIGFNLLVDFVEQPNPAKVDIREATRQMISAFEILREKGIYEDRLMRRIEPFIEGRIFLKECGAYGNQIVVAPDGRIGPCHAFIGTRDYFVGNVHDTTFDPRNNEIFQQWNDRNPFRMSECQDCPFITLCGGGCAYQAFVLHGNINQKDDRICEHIQELVDWLLNDLWNKQKISEKSVNVL